MIEVRGELDIYTTPDLEAELSKLGPTAPEGVVVDLSASEFVDASACRALLRAARRLRERDAELVVVTRNPEIERILDVMGLEEFLTIVPSRRDAEETLARR